MEHTLLILKRNEVLFNEGDSSNCMYDIKLGKVGIFANYGTKEEKLLTELKEGQFFGEMGIIEGYPRSATAVAMGDMTELTVIAKNEFEDYCKANPEKAILIMRNMSARIRDLTKGYIEVCRTVSEAMEAQQNARKNEGLMNRLRMYRKQYNDACKYASSIGMDVTPFDQYNR